MDLLFQSIVGSEAANFGLCQYPSVIDWDYRPAADARFQEKYQPHGQGWTSFRFSWQKWERWLRRQAYEALIITQVAES